MTELQLDHLREWIGRAQNVTDTFNPSPAERMASTLDQTRDFPPGAELPPGWHWLYFLPTTPQRDISDDGHARRGGFLPPVPLPRRMWAGGRLRFYRPPRIGQMVERRSEIVGVTHKQGRSGQLVFVTVHHTLSDGGGVLLVEEQDLVYREAASGTEPARKSRPAPDDGQWSQDYEPDPVWLFRYSALTFNGHRIHYDRSFCMDVEGYPGLVVHGPLIATLLLDLIHSHAAGRYLASFSFRALSPLFDTHSFSVNGRIEAGDQKASLWAANHRGELAMQAEVEFSD